MSCLDLKLQEFNQFILLADMHWYFLKSQESLLQLHLG